MTFKNLHQQKFPGNLEFPGDCPRLYVWKKHWITKFVFGRSSAPDPAERTHTGVPQTPKSAGDGDTLPHCPPLDAFGVLF